MGDLVRSVICSNSDWDVFGVFPSLDRTDIVAAWFDGRQRCLAVTEYKERRVFDSRRQPNPQDEPL